MTQAEIYACGNRAIKKTTNNLKDGFRRAKVFGINIYNYYAMPRITLDEFILMIEKLVAGISRHNQIIMADDFNPWFED